MGTPLMYPPASRPDLPERIARLETTVEHEREIVRHLCQELQELKHHPASTAPAPATHHSAPSQITDGTWWVLVKFAAAVVLMVAAAVLAASGQADLANKLGGAVRAMP